jgi:hypothetical protein
MKSFYADVFGRGWRETIAEWTTVQTVYSLGGSVLSWLLLWTVKGKELALDAVSAGSATVIGCFAIGLLVLTRNLILAPVRIAQELEKELTELANKLEASNSQTRTLTVQYRAGDNRYHFEKNTKVRSMTWVGRVSIHNSSPLTVDDVRVTFDVIPLRLGHNRKLFLANAGQIVRSVAPKSHVFVDILEYREGSDTIRVMVAPVDQRESRTKGELFQMKIIATGRDVPPARIRVNFGVISGKLFIDPLKD